MVVSSILFFIGGLTRANGVVNAAFILHFGLTKLARERRYFVFFFSILATAFAAAPFFLVQAWHVLRFCPIDLPGISIPVSDFPVYRRAWCPNSDVLQSDVWTIFSASTKPYSYVQAKHWHVGFLASWRARKIPEFVIVLPIFLFSVFRYLGAWFGANKQNILNVPSA